MNCDSSTRRDTRIRQASSFGTPNRREKTFDSAESGSQASSHRSRLVSCALLCNAMNPAPGPRLQWTYGMNRQVLEQ
jgi:hypothetical protein